VGEEGVARLGQLHPARRPDEELRVEISLETLQAGRQRRLGDEQRVGRAAHGAGARDLDEGLDLGKKHKCSLYRKFKETIWYISEPRLP